MTQGAGAPDISVVMPTHDVGDWIDECLTSILEDQDVSLELIAVDDGSRDDTWQRLLARAARDERLRVVRALGIGGAQARNYGVELARGRYLAFVDGDDIVPSGAYAAMLAAAERSGSDLVVGDFLKFSATRTWSPTARWDGFAERRQGTTLAEVPILVRNRACWNRLFRADFWHRAAIAYPSVPRSNDIVPMVSALVEARTIDVVPDLVYLYRERPGGTSMTAKASAEIGVSSYFSQELLCARLVGAVPGAELAETYWQMVLDSDGWVHVRRYARDRGDDVTPEAPSEVPALVAELLALRDATAWEWLPDEKQVVFALVSLGRVEWAHAVLDALGDGGVPVVPLDPAVGVQVARTIEGTGLLTPETVRTFVYKHVVEAVAASTEPRGLDFATALVELVGDRRAWFEAAPATIERPQDARVRRALATGDAESLAVVAGGATSVRLTSMVVKDRAVELALDVPEVMTGGKVTVRALMLGDPGSMREVARVRVAGGSATAVVPARAFPREGSWVLEVHVEAEDQELQYPLLIDRSGLRKATSRWGRLVLRGVTGGTQRAKVFKRPTVAARVYRAVRRRVRG